MNAKRGIRTALAAALGVIALVALPAGAAAKDRNHDHIPDRWERHHHLSLQLNQSQRDQDGDQLPNRGEFLAGDNPHSADSDNDGVEDGEENAGTIESFDAASGKLTISLFGGETISGMVTEATEIKCEHSATASASDDGESSSSDRGGNEEESGDSHGEGGTEGDSHGEGEEPGDDNGGHGEEPGDDNGGQSGTCTTADLVPGAVVKQAEIEVEQGTASFHEVELG
jgi:hypothetical protein